MDQVEGEWSPEEDEMLENLMEKHGPKRWSLIGTNQSSMLRWLQNLIQKHVPNWSLISKSLPGRSGQSCLSRWLFVHRPFTPEEDETILRAHTRLGDKWSAIGRLLTGRTDDVIKNRWNSILKWKSSSMTNEDITIDAHKIYIPPPSFSDMTRDNVSRPSGGTHSYSRDQSAPSWNALKKRDSSTMMIDSDNVQEFAGDEFGWNDFPEVSSKKYKKTVVTNEN